MHPEGASRDNPQVPQTVKPLVRFGCDKDDSALLAQSQLFKRNDEGFHLFFKFGTTFPSWNGLPMDAGGGMSEKGAGACRHCRAQDVFEFAGLFFHFLFGHLKNFIEEPLCQTVTSNDLSRLLLPAFFEDHAIAFYFKEIILDHLTENGPRFYVLGRLKKVVHISNSFFS